MITGIWLVGFVIVLCLLVASTVRDGECLVDVLYPNDVLQNMSLGISLLFEICLPLCLMIFLYAKLFVIIRSSKDSLGIEGQFKV